MDRIEQSFAVAALTGFFVFVATMAWWMMVTT